MLLSVMVIDDNPADRLWIKMMLEKSQQYSEITLVNSAVEALGIFGEPEASEEKWKSAFPPDLIFLDINMPRMDGFEFLVELKKMLIQQKAKCPEIIMWVDVADPQSRAQALKHDFVVDTLAKPLSVNEAKDLAQRIRLSKS